MSTVRVVMSFPSYRPREHRRPRRPNLTQFFATRGKNASEGRSSLDGHADRPHIAVATDTRYLPWCATVVRSCLEQCREGVCVHVLHDGGISPADQQRLGEMGRELGGDVRVHAVDTSPLRAVEPNARFGGYTALLRLLLPRSLPDISRVIYLDVDTLVVAPFGPLWDTDLRGMPLAAVRNVVEPSMYGHLASLGIDDPKGSLNSGVLVIDLDLVRAEGSFDETLGVLANLTHAPWFDQDALNVVFRGRWHALHPRWNAMNSLWVWARWATDVFGPDAVREATTSPAILHFEGPKLMKPWHYVSTHPWCGVYRETLARTPWRDTPLEGRNAATRLINVLPSAWRLPAYVRLSSAKRFAGRVRALRDGPARMS